MWSVKKALCCLLILGTSINVQAQSPYISTNRDTSVQNQVMSYESFNSTGYDLIHETTNLRYYFRDDRDIIAVEDKRNGYTWKTGLDIEFGSVIDQRCEEASEEDKVSACVPKEHRLNTTYIGVANSLITIEYYDESNNIKRISSASEVNAKSTLQKVETNEGKFILDVSFSKPKIQIKVNIQLRETGIDYKINDKDVSGADEGTLAAILITPFLGASGGQEKIWNTEIQDYDQIVDKPMVPGYVLVPDGPGALIRFQDNTTSLIDYVGNVYGEDYAQSEFYQREETQYVEMKNPVLPVFGIAHGQQQSAFVAYANDGAEYMEIVASPEENMTSYTWAYPRFVYNTLYHQVYNKRGDGYYTLLSERNHFDISMSYGFLEGKGDLSADYFGMAKTYQAALVEQGVLKKSEFTKDTPIRLDFLMSDMKNSVLGKEEIVVTTVEDIRKILNDLQSVGVTNINSGLLGYQKGGITFSTPGKVKWSRRIGSKQEFTELIEEFNNLGIDISFTNDYLMFSPNELMEYNTSVKHVNGWYLRYYLLSQELPEIEFTYARPSISSKWLYNQTALLAPTGINSLTIDGITNTLLSDYTKDDISLTKAKELFVETFIDLSNDYQINAVKPNAYLLASIDRYLQAPVFSSQYLIETDTVPFLQIVLADMMEIYAPYANFSFSSPEDILRMIDYNVFPSFVLTQQPSHYLSATNSSNYYSTEYASYKDIIASAYTAMNETLANVKNQQWISREVIEPGVVVNTYENKAKIIINYTDYKVSYEGYNVDPISYGFIG